MPQTYVLTREVIDETPSNIKSPIFATTIYSKLLDKVKELRAGAKIRLYECKFELHYFNDAGELTDSCQISCER